jgi:hypothetical protein
VRLISGTGMPVIAENKVINKVVPRITVRPYKGERFF